MTSVPDLVKTFIDPDAPKKQWFYEISDPAGRIGDIVFLSAFTVAFANTWSLSEDAKTELLQSMEDMNRVIEENMPRTLVLVKVQALQTQLLLKTLAYCTTPQYRWYLTKILTDNMKQMEDLPSIHTLTRNQTSIGIFYDFQENKIVALPKFVIAEFDTNNLTFVPKMIKKQFAERFVYIFDVCQIALTITNVVDMIAFESVSQLLVQ